MIQKLKLHGEINKWDIYLLVILISILVIFNLFLFSRVKGNIEVSCNSGKIGLNYSGNWSEAKINGIDNLNCQAKINYDAPVWTIFILKQ